jgi:hypothetical protein
MYIHDKKSGLILPIPFYLLWRYKIHLLVFGVVAQCVAPFLWLAIPKEGYLAKDAESAFAPFHERCIRGGRDPAICQLNYPVEKKK